MNCNWLWKRALTIQQKLTKEGTAVIQKHFFTTFLSRYNVQMPAMQRNRNKPKEVYRDNLMKWYNVTREHLISTGGNSD